MVENYNSFAGERMPPRLLLLDAPDVDSDVEVNWHRTRVIRQAAARLFTRLRSGYAKKRADWLAHWLEEELLGDLLTDLRHGAEVPECEAFGEVEETAHGLASLVGYASA